MIEIRRSYFKKMQLAMLSLGLVAVLSFFFLYVFGMMNIPFFIVVEASFISILIFYSFYRVMRSKTYDEQSTDIILFAFFVHCIVVYYLVDFDPLRVVWFQVFISLVFLFKGVVKGLIVMCLSLGIVLLGNTFVFTAGLGFYDAQLLWTFITSTVMISGASAVMSRYYEALFLAAYSVSQMDGLTSALNSKAYRERCEEILKASKLNHLLVNFCLIDLDKFKELNDSKGHLFGDEVLMVFSTTIKENLNENVLFGRLGGDEFSLMALSSELDEANMKVLLQNTIEAVGDKVGYHLDASFGFSSSDVSGYNFNHLYKNSDLNMYKHKAGKMARL